MSEIVNKVEESGIVTVDLTDYLPHDPITELDIAPQLWQGMILKEKEFRHWVKETNWEEFRGHHLALFCSADAIVPVWAYMLIATATFGITSGTHLGKMVNVKETLLESAITQLDTSEFEGKRIMIKGCGEGIPERVYLTFVAQVQGVALTIMYGEPCGAVPLWKKPRNRT
ncbi:MAG: DUF2480 family protein [Flavobacteriales bacterium]|nr:DUF2480 family protein [Flavobacteriales bacterium]